jgi:hypothetical protein
MMSDSPAVSIKAKVYAAVVVVVMLNRI